MHTGIIRFFLQDKNFGYVRMDDSLEEFYIPGRKLKHLQLSKGDQIRFSIKKKGGQLIATDVELIKKANPNSSEPPTS